MPTNAIVWMPVERIELFDAPPCGDDATDCGWAVYHAGLNGVDSVMVETAMAGKLCFRVRQDGYAWSGVYSGAYLVVLLDEEGEE